MSDWFESLKSVVTERVSSPLMFAYALAWPIINYQIVLMVFSDAKVLDKIAFVSTQYGGWQGQLYYLGWPLVVAFVYMLGMPWLSHVNLAYTFWQGKFTRDMRLKHEKAIMISESERDELISNHREELDRLHTELGRKAATYSDLGRQNESLLERLAEGEAKISSLNNEASALAEKVAGLEADNKARTEEVDRLVEVVESERGITEKLRKVLPGLKIYDGSTIAVDSSDDLLRIKEVRGFVKDAERHFSGMPNQKFRTSSFS